MNVMDRSFSAEAAKEAAKLGAIRRRRWKIAVGIAVAVLAAAIYYVWATTLCGDCGAPAILPPPA